jgi:hypothetical protein
MAATIRTTAQAFLTSGTTSSITIPVSVQAGDLLVLHVAGYFTPTLPTGWTKYYTRAGTNVGCFVITKTAGSGDAGTSVSLSWSGNGQAVMTMIAVVGSLGVRSIANLWASNGGNASPGALNALNGDMVLYLGANRSGGGVPVVSRGSVDVSGTGTTSMGGVIAHEVLVADAPGLQASFTSPSGGSTQGYSYSTLVIAGVTAPATVAGISLRDKAQAFVNGTSTTITIPATIQAGDLLVLQAVGAWAPTLPSGWSSLYANSGSNIGSLVASKTAGAGDAGSIVTITWSGNQSGVLNLIALVTPGYGLRRMSNDWSSSGATDTPNDLSSANNGDWILALGANRAASNVPIVPGATVDASGTGGTTAFSSIIAHEPLGYDIINASYQFNAPSGGSGYQYSLLVVAASPVIAARILSRQSAEVLAISSTTNRLLSHQSAEVLASESTTNRRLSRQSVEVLTPSKLRFRGWGVRY